MRLLLWDCDDRNYSFYIETSYNQKDWVMVVDKRNEQARSWQNFSFNPLPVVFIRIVGTRNTANEIFHCVHLECPSQDPNVLLIEKEKQRAVEEKKQQRKLADNQHSSSRESTPRISSRRRQPPHVEEDVLVQIDNSSLEESNLI